MELSDLMGRCYANGEMAGRVQKTAMLNDCRTDSELEERRSARSIIIMAK